MFYWKYWRDGAKHALSGGAFTSPYDTGYPGGCKTNVLTDYRKNYAWCDGYWWGVARKERN